jgi:hypothetical protein
MLALHNLFTHCPIVPNLHILLIFLIGPLLVKGELSLILHSSCLAKRDTALFNSISVFHQVPLVSVLLSFSSFKSMLLLHLKFSEFYTNIIILRLLKQRGLNHGIKREKGLFSELQNYLHLYK